MIIQHLLVALYRNIIFLKPHAVALNASVKTKDNQKAAEKHHNVKPEAKYILKYLLPNYSLKHFLSPCLLIPSSTRFPAPWRCSIILLIIV